MWIGAPGEDTVESNAGRAHAFSLIDIGCSSLSVGPEEVSSHAPKAVHFEINAGPKFAGEPYFMVGTAQPFTHPTMVGGLALPLTMGGDYSLYLLYNVNQNGQKNTAAYLDDQGRGKATIDLAQTDVALLNGMQLHHAFFSFTELGQATFMSSVATVDIIW